MLQNPRRKDVAVHQRPSQLKSLKRLLRKLLKSPQRRLKNQRRHHQLRNRPRRLQMEQKRDAVDRLRMWYQLLRKRKQRPLLQSELHQEKDEGAHQRQRSKNPVLTNQPKQKIQSKPVKIQ